MADDAEHDDEDELELDELDDELDRELSGGLADCELDEKTTSGRFVLQPVEHAFAPVDNLLFAVDSGIASLFCA